MKTGTRAVIRDHIKSTHNLCSGVSGEDLIQEVGGKDAVEC